MAARWGRGILGRNGFGDERDGLMLRNLLRGLAAALCATLPPLGAVSAQMPASLPAGPKVSIVAVT